MSSFRFGPAAGFGGVVRNLIIANAVVFLVQLLAGPRFVAIFGLVPRAVLGNFAFWQPVTYLFLHGDLFHILLNMYVLWMFGSAIEHAWGSREFLKYYFVCGIGAGILTVLSSPSSPIPTIGASGAIFGLLLAYGLLFPNRYVLLNFFFPIKAKYLVLIFGALELLSSIRYTSDGIAHFAHLGGMLVGFVYLKLDWRLTSLKKQFSKPAMPRRPRIVPGGSGIDDERELEREVDRILSKISEQGLDSLTDDERETLERASRRFGSNGTLRSH
jgi:membrane associated rhomboid family serine protease